jgi:hypothetical protein
MYLLYLWKELNILFSDIAVVFEFSEEGAPRSVRLQFSRRSILVSFCVVDHELRLPLHSFYDGHESFPDEGSFYFRDHWFL